MSDNFSANPRIPSEYLPLVWVLTVHVTRQFLSVNIHFPFISIYILFSKVSASSKERTSIMNSLTRCQLFKIAGAHVSLCASAVLHLGRIVKLQCSKMLPFFEERLHKGYSGGIWSLANTADMSRSIQEQPDLRVGPKPSLTDMKL